ncbi:MAG: phosphoenolpyruvate--protein phosphotransferase [Endomicrobium sp.]|jgi:phosphotransferase system enzyme I (PtsI)|nr:phosphoenolpyruvate--protein phosphotransferase [Endomicrobium sp.]
MTEKKQEIVYQGVAVSSGIVSGKVFLLAEQNFVPLHKEVPPDLRKKELDRLKKAIAQTRADIKTTSLKIDEMLGTNYAKIADVQLLILDDPIMRKDIISMIENGDNAENAVYKASDKINRSFETIGDEYFKERRFDIQDVSKRLIENLLGGTKQSLANIERDSIVVAHNLTPADTVSIREKFIKGFATDIGGKTSHTAIIAQGFEIPAVVGLKNLSRAVKSGDDIIIDGNKGIVIINPSAQTISVYEKEFDIWFAEHQELEKLKDLPAQTLDGVQIKLLANIDNPDETEYALKNGALGIGLYRTEFMYFNRVQVPTEEEHFENYKKTAQRMSPFETVIRTIDLGGDKLSKLGFLNIDEESNPFMGLRAIRLCFKYPDIFLQQLRGILRASAFAKIKIMYPMISGLQELRMANALLQRAKDDLRKEKIDFDGDIEVGAMIEVPSAAIITDILAKELDFVSIGTNDLIQYTLAVDRVNETVAELYEPLHPAILRLLKKIIDDAHRAGIKAAMCGEMAGDPKYASILLGFGLDEFSVSSAQAPKIKRAIRNIKMSSAKLLSQEILKIDDIKEIEKLLN